MNSWIKFGAAASVAAFLTGMSFGQSCGSPLTAGEGDTPVATTAGVVLNLAGICDPGTFGDDSLYNVSYYRFVAPQSATYVVQTCNSVNYDSRLAVMLDCSNAASTLACNDDGGSGCNISGSGLPYASKLQFVATAGSTYYIAVGGYSAADSGGGSMNIAVAGGGGGGGGGAECAAATDVFDGTNSFDTSAASAVVDLAGLCDPGPFGDDALYNVVWVKYVATSTSNTEVSTCNIAPFDTRLAVFTSCDFSSVVACNDDGPGCANFSSKLSFASNVGQTYYIAIGGYSPTDAGAGSMLITPNSVTESCGTSTQDCCVANAAPFCSDSDCCSTVCGVDPYCCDTQWDAICADEATTLCTVCGAGQCDLPSSTSSEIEACGNDTNGGCNDALGSVETLTLPASVAGTFWADGNTRDTDWFEFSVGAGTQLSINLYSKGPGVTYLLDNACPPAIIATPAGSGSCPASISFCVPAGTYRIFVGMNVFAGFPCGGDRNDYVLEVSGTPCDASAPANDECDNAIVVPAAGGSENFDTTFATTSGIPLDPSCDEGFGTSFVKDVWYKWTPSASGLGKATTCNAASFDTRIAIYEDCFGSLVACNDDAAGCGLTSEATWAATAGTEYLVRVGGYSGGGTGTVTISLGLPAANDECTGATQIFNGDTAFDTSGASNSALPLDPSCDEGFGLAIVKDIWFYYDATCSDTVTVSTCGTASFDTRLAAYTDCNGTIVACNDDGPSCPNFTSLMTFSATTGTRYYIRVGGFLGGGTGTLNVACGTGGGGLTNDTCATPTVAVNGANSFTNVGAVSDAPTTSPGFCGSFGTNFFNDVWFSYTATMSGTATFSLCNTAPFDSRIELWNVCPTAGGTVLACNDDATGCGLTSVMTYDLTCGTTYLVRVGAYGSTGFGAGTLTVTPGTGACAPPCPADLNGDHVVNGADIGLLLGNWGNSGVGDINNDGIVNGADIGMLLGAWGPCPS